MPYSIFYLVIYFAIFMLAIVLNEHASSTDADSY